MIYLSYFLMTLLGFLGLFLIGLVLLQRGRGGGLVGAFGGMGGQGAFGNKAGDVFTRITVGVAAVWILLCAGSVVALHNTKVNRATDFADEAKVKADDAKAEAEQDRLNNREDNLGLDNEENKPDAANSPAGETPPNAPSQGESPEGETPK